MFYKYVPAQHLPWQRAKPRLDSILGNFVKYKRVEIHCEQVRIGIQRSMSDWVSIFFPLTF